MTTSWLEISMSETLGLLQFLFILGGGVWAASKFKSALDFLGKDFSKLETKLDNLNSLVRENHEKGIWDLRTRVGIIEMKCLAICTREGKIKDE